MTQELLFKMLPEIEPSISNPIQVGLDAAGVSKPVHVKKTWGWEDIYYNDLYCMKLLHFSGVEKASKDKPVNSYSTSAHFHKLKHEALLVVNGTLTVEIIVNKKKEFLTLEKGKALVVPPGFVHRLIALDGPVDLIEASTKDFSHDSIRLY